VYVLINSCLKVGWLSVYYSHGLLRSLTDLKKNRHQKVFFITSCSSLDIQAVMCTCLKSQLLKVGLAGLQFVSLVWPGKSILVNSIFFQTKSVH